MIFIQIVIFDFENHTFGRIKETQSQFLSSLTNSKDNDFFKVNWPHRSPIFI